MLLIFMTMSLKASKNQYLEPFLEPENSKKNNYIA